MPLLYIIFPSPYIPTPSVYPPTCVFLLLCAAVELNYGIAYCFKCKDYIYDAELDAISRETLQQLAQKQCSGEMFHTHAAIVPVSLSPIVPVSLSPIVPVSLSSIVPVSLSPIVPVSLSPIVPVSLSSIVPVSLSPIVPVSLSPNCGRYVISLPPLALQQPTPYMGWEPSTTEIDLLRQNPKRRKVEYGSTIGKQPLARLKSTFLEPLG